MSLRLGVVILGTLTACAEDPTIATDDSAADSGAAPAPATLSIAGTYLDEYGTTHTIDEAAWTTQYAGYPASVFHVSQFDDDGQWLVAQNDPANGYNPDLWSRFDWLTGADGHLYYCQSAFAAPTEQAAVDTPRDEDLDVGCGGFPWTDLTP
jgi:hypothetical protein